MWIWNPPHGTQFFCIVNGEITHHTTVAVSTTLILKSPVSAIRMLLFLWYLILIRRGIGGKTDGGRKSKEGVSAGGGVTGGECSGEECRTPSATLLYELMVWLASS